MRPTELTRYIALVVAEELDIEVAKDWYRLVRERAPHGVLTTVEVTDNSGTKSAAMVKRVNETGTYYAVPLARDLLEAEATRIIAGFTNLHPDLDFDVEATVVRTGQNGAKPPSVNVEQQRYIELCTDLARQQHEDWVKSRTDAGWRYGQTVSVSQKTHPLLRPWEQLPDQFRSIDTQSPQRMLDMLNQHGYAVVSREDLDAIFKLVRAMKPNTD